MKPVKPLTWDGVIVECHSRQVWVDMSTFEPPFQDIFILNIFGPGGQVACKLVDVAFISRMKRGEAVEDIIS
jgi:hypothetical protein